MKIGFIGLGTMGAHMAANLQKGGYALVVHDVHRPQPPALVREAVVPVVDGVPPQDRQGQRARSPAEIAPSPGEQALPTRHRRPGRRGRE